MKAGKNTLIESGNTTVMESALASLNRDAENLFNPNSLILWDTPGTSLDDEILHYDFSNSADMGEDSSGNGNDGTATDVTQMTGPFGKAGSFNGSTSVITIPSYLNTAKWEVAFNSSFNNFTNNSVFLTGDTTFTFLFTVTTAGTLRVYLSSNNSSWDIASGTAGTTVLNTSTNYFFDFSFDGSNYIFKINGVEELNITSSSEIYSGSSMDIGKFFGDVLDGYIADFRIYDRTLTDAEKTSLYTNNGLNTLAESLFTFTDSIAPAAVALMNITAPVSVQIDVYSAYPATISDTITVNGDDMRGLDSKNVYLEITAGSIEAIKITMYGSAVLPNVGAGWLWAGNWIDFGCAEEMQPFDQDNASATITRGNTTDVNASYLFQAYNITLKKDQGFEELRAKIRALLAEGYATPRPYLINEPFLQTPEILLGLLDSGKVGYDNFYMKDSAETYSSQVTIGLRETRGLTNVD